VQDPHAFRLTPPQEPHNIDIHESYFLQIQVTLRSLALELFFQFSQMLRLKTANQANRGLTAVRTLFDLQYDHSPRWTR